MSGKVGRIVLWVVAVALLVIAWRAQFAFQFADERTLWGWRTLGAVGALWLLWWAVTRGTMSDRAPLAPRVEALLALLLIGLGIAFRVVHFSTVPPGMNHDAAFNGMYALDVLQGAPYTPYVSAAWGRETLFMYLCTPLVAWLGNRRSRSNSRRPWSASPRSRSSTCSRARSSGRASRCSAWRCSRCAAGTCSSRGSAGA
jgi:hypothetical protein